MTPIATNAPSRPMHCLAQFRGAGRLRPLRQHPFRKRSGELEPSFVRLEDCPLQSENERLLEERYGVESALNDFATSETIIGTGSGFLRHPGAT